jgi:hypothetical protein
MKVNFAVPLSFPFILFGLRPYAKNEKCPNYKTNYPTSHTIMLGLSYGHWKTKLKLGTRELAN